MNIQEAVVDGAYIVTITADGKTESARHTDKTYRSLSTIPFDVRLKATNEMHSLFKPVVAPAPVPPPDPSEPTPYLDARPAIQRVSEIPRQTAAMRARRDEAWSALSGQQWSPRQLRPLGDRTPALRLNMITSDTPLAGGEETLVFETEAQINYREAAREAGRRHAERVQAASDEIVFNALSGLVVIDDLMRPQGPG